MTTSVWCERPGARGGVQDRAAGRGEEPVRSRVGVRRAVRGCAVVGRERGVQPSGGAAGVVAGPPHRSGATTV
ncbi:hypothetical protein CCE01nite_38140 [Cellulomonas cellasea]|uniref:Uncharacterized protein n=1 Tax=Cellulomonas cellasea TaxID=43670 RepID=A0A4Y3L323_9CELL|nr:hypothetical protein CCE01nite_38140 [Cellulomonas cellasea]